MPIINPDSNASLKDLVEKIQPRPLTSKEKARMMGRSGIAAFRDIDYSPFLNGVYLCIQQVQRMFDVTQVTVFNWRKNKGLPEIRIKRNKTDLIMFDEGAVKQWAILNDKPIVNQDYLDVAVDNDAKRLKFNSVEELQ